MLIWPVVESPYVAYGGMRQFVIQYQLHLFARVHTYILLVDSLATIHVNRKQHEMLASLNDSLSLLPSSFQSDYTVQTLKIDATEGQFGEKK